MSRSRPIRTLLVLVTCLAISAPTHAADVAGGIEAFCAKRFAEAFKILEPLAEKGNSDAQLIMGIRFFHGMDGKRDPERARRWYTKAAEQGDAEAQVYLGQMLAQGQGGELDLGEAVNWFRKAAEAGYSAGQYNLGYAYCTGQGVSRDTVQGRDWYQKAAEQGDVWAQSNLGTLLIGPGQGGASKVTGCTWLLLASKKGDEEASKLLERQRPLMAADEWQQAEQLARQFEPKPTATTQAITRRCRPGDAEASGTGDRSPLRDLVEKDLGPQAFKEPSIESAGSNDSLIVTAVEAAVALARMYQFHYDASGSAEGRVVVKALWKGDPVTLTMRFFRREEALYIASGLSQSAKSFLKKRGQKIEQLFYSQLLQETKARGLQIFSDPDAKP